MAGGYSSGAGTCKTPFSQANAILKAAQIKWGSGFARESRGSVNINGCWADVFAGKPAPTGDLRLTERHSGKPAHRPSAKRGTWRLSGATR
ncbi:hypothetical protein D7M10_14835 [Pseudomonas fluorescens]|nr:hypothetical protein D7M10_14835 [Pseudomonas fluorescens]